MPADRRGSFAVQAGDPRQRLFVEWDRVGQSIVERGQVGAQEMDLRNRSGGVRIGAAIGLRGKQCKRFVQAIEGARRIGISNAPFLSQGPRQVTH